MNNKPLFHEPMVVILGAYLGVAFGSAHQFSIESSDLVYRITPSILAFGVFIWVTYVFYMSSSAIQEEKRSVFGNTARVLVSLFSVAILVLSACLMFFPNVSLMELSPLYIKIVLSYCPLFLFSSLYTISMLASR